MPILMARINAILATSAGFREIDKVPTEARGIEIGTRDVRVEEIRILDPDTLRGGEKADVAEKGIELANDGPHARLGNIDIRVSKGDDRGSLRAKRGKDVPRTHEIVAGDVARGAGIGAVGIDEIVERGNGLESGDDGVRHGHSPLLGRFIIACFCSLSSYLFSFFRGVRGRSFRFDGFNIPRFGETSRGILNLFVGGFFLYLAPTLSIMHDSELGARVF